MDRDHKEGEMKTSQVELTFDEQALVAQACQQMGQDLMDTYNQTDHMAVKEAVSEHAQTWFQLAKKLRDE